MLARMLNFNGKVFNTAANGQFFSYDPATQTTFLNYLGGAGTVRQDPKADPGGVWFAALQAQSLSVGADLTPNLLNYDGKVYDMESNGMFFDHDSLTGNTTINYVGGSATIRVDTMVDPGGVWFAALVAGAVTV